MSTVPNDQTLPTGLGAQAPAQQPVIPSQEVTPAPAPVVQPPAVNPMANNPMLSHVTNTPAPVPPTGHLPPTAKPAEAPPADRLEPTNTGSVQDLVGDLANDPYAKPSISYIENICGTAGVDLARAFNKAVEYGDTALIDVAYLREKLGANADAVISQATALFEYSANQTQVAMAAVYEAAGGEAVLKQAVPYFNQAADPAERAEIQYLLDSGNKELMARAAKRVVEFSRRAGMTYTPQTQPLGSPSAVQGLSKAAYIEAISKNNISPEKYAQLREQRKLGIHQGI